MRKIPIQNLEDIIDRFVYVHNSLFKFGCKDTNSNPFAQFSTYNNLNFKIFKVFFWFV